MHVHTLNQFFGLFIVLMILKLFLNYAENIDSLKQGELFVKDLREKIFSAQLSWSAESFLQRSYGKYLLRYSNDMKAVQNYFTKGILAGIMNFIFITTGLFILAKINLWLTLIFIGGLLFVYAAVFLLSSFQKPFIRASRSNRSSLLAFVAKSFSSFEKIKQRQREKESIEKFNLRSDNLYLSIMRMNRIESLLLSVTPFFIFAMISFLLWQMTRRGIIVSAGDGLMMILTLLMLQGHLRKLFKVPGYINKGKISLQKIARLLQQQGEEPKAEPLVN